MIAFLVVTEKSLLTVECVCGFYLYIQHVNKFYVFNKQASHVPQRFSRLKNHGKYFILIGFHELFQRFNLFLLIYLSVYIIFAQ